MVAPFIALEYRTSPQIIRYAGTSAALVGASFGVADSTTTSNLAAVFPRGRVIRFGGLNTYVATVGSSIYRSTDGGMTWTAVQSLTDLNSNTHRKSGFVVVYLNGVPALAMIYGGTTNTQVYGVYSFDGINWTTQGPFTVLGGGGGAGAVIGYNQLIVQDSTIFLQLGSAGGGTTAGTDNTVIWTPGSNNAVGTSLSGIQSGQLAPSLCEFNNRLFGLYQRTTSSALTLGEIVGQTTVVLTSLQLGEPTTSGGAGTLFVDGVNMYAIATGSDGAGTNTGLKAWQISSSLVVTEITSTVLPAILRTAFSTDGSGAVSCRILSLIDGVSSPGSSPTIYLYFSSTGNSDWALYQWNGNATEISLISQGGSTLNSMPLFGFVNGDYFVADSVFPSTSGISAEIINRTFTATGVRLSFKLYGTAGSVSFRAYYGDANSEYPTNAATLTNPSVGAISGGTTNTGLTADDGATTYQVTWDAQTDGFTQNSQYRLVGNAFV